MKFYMDNGKEFSDKSKFKPAHESDDVSIIKISSDMYYTASLKLATMHVRELSELESDLFSVIWGYSGSLEKNVFFIERGVPLIRTGETLIAEYESGVKIR